MEMGHAGAAERHAAIAEVFGAIVDAVPDTGWDMPSPVAEWRARDVVGHLVGWLPGLLQAGADLALPAGPPVEEDPASAWHAHATAVQAVLDDPATADAAFDHPMAGSMTVAEAIDRLYTTDVFLHTWDLGRATGQDVDLDRAQCAELLEGMGQIEQLLRDSGQFGPAVAVPEDADVQDRLVGFIGRDPTWTPPTSVAT